MTRAVRLIAIAVVCAVWVPAHAAGATQAGAPPASTLREGAALFARGRLADAEATFTRAVTRKPKDHLAWVWLGVVEYHRGDYAQAAAAFEYAARLQPRDTTALLWWGHTLLRTGQSEAAEAAFRRVLLTKGSPRAYEQAVQSLRVIRAAPALAAPDAAVGPAAPGWVLAVESYRALARYYNPRLRPEEADLIARSLLQYSRQFNLDPRLVVALVVVESGFQPRARSRVGAMGLGQLMPATARALGVNPDDPAQNLYGTIRYLRGNLDRFGWGNVHLALAAYNAGRGAVERYEGIPPYDETRWYVYNVTSLYRRLLAI